MDRIRFAIIDRRWYNALVVGKARIKNLPPDARFVSLQNWRGGAVFEFESDQWPPPEPRAAPRSFQPRYQLIRPEV